MGKSPFRLERLPTIARANVIVHLVSSCIDIGMRMPVFVQTAFVRWVFGLNDIPLISWRVTTFDMLAGCFLTPFVSRTFLGHTVFRH